MIKTVKDECTQHVQRPQSTTRAHARPQGGLLITLYTPTTSRTNGTDSVRRSVASSVQSDGKCSSKTGSSKRRTGASTARAPLHAVRARRIHSLAVAARRVPGMIKEYLPDSHALTADTGRIQHPHAQEAVSAGPGRHRGLAGRRRLLLHRLQHDRDFPAARRQYHHRRRGVLQSALVSGASTSGAVQE